MFIKHPYTAIFTGPNGVGNVWLVEPKDKLYDYIEKLSNLEAGNAVLFIVDDIIADESLY